MNLHPLFVHFPIALLFLYAILEMLRFNFLTRQPYWFYVKGTMVIVGTVSAIPALITGDAIETTIGPALRQTVEMHQFFAFTSTAIFGLLSLAYIIAWIQKQKTITNGWWNISINYSVLILDSPLVIILALAGLIAIAITGGLGGAMVYGPDADPFFKTIYNLLIK